VRAKGGMPMSWRERHGPLQDFWTIVMDQSSTIQKMSSFQNQSMEEETGAEVPRQRPRLGCRQASKISVVIRLLQCGKKPTRGVLGSLMPLSIQIKRMQESGNQD